MIKILSLLPEDGNFFCDVDHQLTIALIQNMVAADKRYWDYRDMRNFVLALIVHCRKSPYDVYIGRPSKWGNPFEIGPDGTRDEVISKYRNWIKQQPGLMSDLHELEGKTLGCWCSPKSCHGEVLFELANCNTLFDWK